MEYINEGEATAAAGLASIESFEQRGTQREMETISAGEVGSLDEIVGIEGSVGVDDPSNDNFIVTESYVVPPTTPKWHSGNIAGIALLTTKSGTTGIEVKFHSDGNGRDYEQVIWPPVAWVENPRITRDELGELPTAEGRKQSPLQRFGSAISNSKGTGDIDKLLAAAKRADRTTPRPSYTTITEFINMLNTTLAGCPVVFTTREEKNDDPQYQARERVNGVYGYDFDATKLKAYTAASGQ